MYVIARETTVQISFFDIRVQNEHNFLLHPSLEIRLETISNPRVIIYNRTKFSLVKPVFYAPPPPPLAPTHIHIKGSPFQCNSSLLGKMCKLKMARTTIVLGIAMCSSRHTLSNINMKMDIQAHKH